LITGRESSVENALRVVQFIFGHSLSKPSCGLIIP
jgi:hypothetical protein